MRIASNKSLISISSKILTGILVSEIILTGSKTWDILPTGNISQVFEFYLREKFSGDKPVFFYLNFTHFKKFRIYQRNFL